MKKIKIKKSELNFLFKQFLNENNELSKLKKDKKMISIIDSIKKKLNSQKYNYLILKNFIEPNNNSKFQFLKFSKLFGKVLNQNKIGEKMINITPKKNSKKMGSKLRYHQTNIGGSYHSDGPQLYNPPKIILMYCHQNAKNGGETVLVDIKKIFNNFKNKRKDILKILKEKFYFERRGFAKNKIIFKPIFKLNNQKLKFRYLKEYLIHGYKIKNKQLNSKTKKALDALDHEMNRKKNYITEKIFNGDIIIINNDITAHGRKSFSINNNIPRMIFRTWIK